MAVAWLAHDPVEVFSLKSVILMAHGCSVMLPVFFWAGNASCGFTRVSRLFSCAGWCWIGPHSTKSDQPIIKSCEISPNTIPASFYIRPVQLWSWRATVLQSVASTLIKQTCIKFQVIPQTLVSCVWLSNQTLQCLIIQTLTAFIFKLTFFV